MAYDVKATFGNNVGKRGERASLKVEYSNLRDGFAVARSVVRIPEYGIYDVMKREEDGTFTWSYTIPYEAPVQTYVIDVYGIDAEGNKGPVTKVNFQVAG